MKGIFFRFTHPAIAPDCLHVPGHQGKRFPAPVLPLSQGFHRKRVQRITDELVSTNSLDSANLSGINPASYLIQNIVQKRPTCSTGMKSVFRSAAIAGDRLGMKPAVSNGPVFPGTLFAHLKACHGRVFPVIRQLPDDGEPGTAVSTIDKREVYPVRLDLHIRQTFVADSDIGRDIRYFTGDQGAFPDNETLTFILCNREFFYTIDTGSGRKFVLKGIAEFSHLIFCPLCLDGNSLVGVPDPS